MARAEGRLVESTRRLATLGVALLLAQAFAIVVDALSRALLGAPIHGLDDLNRLLIPVTVTTFLPSLFAGRGNIAVDLLGRAFGARASARFEVFGQTMALVFIAVIAWHHGVYAAGLDGRHTVILAWPLAPTAWIATALMALTVAVQAAVVLETLGMLRREAR